MVKQEDSGWEKNVPVVRQAGFQTTPTQHADHLGESEGASGQRPGDSTWHSGHRNGHIRKHGP